MNQVKSVTAHRTIAYVTFRVCFGIDIFLHGVLRFGGNYQKFIDGTMQRFVDSPLPPWSVNIFAHIIPIVEAPIGFCLIIGLWTQLMGVLGSAFMMLLIFGMAVLEKWETVAIQIPYVLFYFVILFLLEYNGYSVDKRLRSST